MITAGNIAATCSKSFSRNISGCGGASPPPGLIPKKSSYGKDLYKMLCCRQEGRHYLRRLAICPRSLFQRLEKIQAVKVRKNAGQGTEIRCRQVNSVVGYAPNVPNYLRGVPVSMIGQNRVRVQSSKVVSIVYNFTVNCGVSEETIINESVKLLSVINSMEKAGYRAGLSVMFSATKGAERYNIIVKVKDPGQYMDLRKLAYILVNPSFLRRHCFRAMETEQELREPWNRGYGGVTEGDVCKDIVKGTPALKDSKYIGFDDLLNRTPEEIEKSLLS